MCIRDRQDADLWGAPARDEAAKRLGWIDLFEDSRALVPHIAQLTRELRAEGVDRVVLAGMGGSSLAPEVIAATAGVELEVLDSTDPLQVSRALERDLERTVLVVSSKSGSTVETDSQRRVVEAAFRDAGIDPRTRLVAVTDPGSPLHAACESAGWRAVFTADPTVGGRFSALTAFGLVPTGLAGVDVAALLDDAEAVLDLLIADDEDNPGLQLGAALGGTRPLRDKLVFADHGSGIAGLPAWIEQLIAESTGKDGTGLLPVVVAPGDPETAWDAPDLLQVQLVGEDDVAAPGHGVQVAGSLGAQLLLWEVATAVATSHSSSWAPSEPATCTPWPGAATSSSPTSCTCSRSGASHAVSGSPGATTTGSSPVPSLPVDSAISCSIQAGSPAMPDPWSAKTSLSRSGRVPPRAAPSCRPGLSSSSAISRSSTASASSSRAATSTPARPVGTRPNAVRAEKRPPTVGSAVKTARQPADSHAACSGEPGSVTATRRVRGSIPASRNAASTTRRCESVSTVEPDLEETTSTVRSRSRSRARETWSGSVESRTSSSTPAVAAITSGARDEPPMPARTTRSTPSARSSRVSWAMCGTRARESSNRSIQPSRLAASSRAGAPHRSASCLSLIHI